MKFKELLEIGKVRESESGKWLCLECNDNKEYTKKGASLHYHYNHTKEGIENKSNISSKLEGKTKKELTKKRLKEEQEKERQEKQLIPTKSYLNRDEIKKFLNNKYGNNDLSNVGRWIKQKYINVYNSIVYNTKYLNSDCIFTERLYHILYDIHSVPKCKKCNNSTTFKTLYYGYYGYCSIKCVANDEDIINKKKETCLEKYGVDHQSKTKQFKDKTIQTNLKNFGVEYPAQSKDVIDKTKELFISKYGEDNPMKVEEFKDKCINSFKDHCINDPSFIDQVIDKKRVTFNKNFGSNHFMKTDSEPKRRIVDIQKQKFDNILNRLLNKLNLEIVDTPYQHAGYRHLWRCTKCNTEFYQIWNLIQQGFLCPTCYPRNNGTSLQEKEVLDFIKELLPNEQIIENSRQIISPKELDIYIPSKNIAIEYNGLYWHSEERISDPNYHLNKFKECQKKNIKLIQIFEDEWLLQQNIVKERLKTILGINNRIRIHARQCDIREIDSKTKNEFLEKFHIQGKDRSIIKLGAFYNNQLISVMTFSHGNIAKGSKSISDVWELNRFCSDFKYHIPGIASKLVTYFKRNYQWKEVFSYADMRWSNGNLYNQIGFNLIGETGVNYWYIKDFQRIHRFNLRKQKHESKDIPEWALRQSEGYYRIFDCGSLKYQINNNINGTV